MNQEQLKQLAQEAIEIVDLIDTGKRDRIIDSLDPYINAICEDLGYGAVMDSAARQWRKKDPIGSHTTGPCVVHAKELKQHVRTLAKLALKQSEALELAMGALEFYGNHNNWRYGGSASNFDSLEIVGDVRSLSVYEADVYCGGKRASKAIQDAAHILGVDKMEEKP